jgi:hypothetical protein
MKQTRIILTIALSLAIGAVSQSMFAAEKKDDHGHAHHGLPESKIAVPADAAGIWKAIGEQQKTLTEQLAASQFEKTDDTIGALAKLIQALPAKAAADKAKMAKGQTKAAVNVLEDIHHLADDKAKAKAEAKLPLLDSALKAIQASVPGA